MIQVLQCVDQQFTSYTRQLILERPVTRCMLSDILINILGVLENWNNKRWTMQQHVCMYIYHNLLVQYSAGIELFRMQFLHGHSCFIVACKDRVLDRCCTAILWQKWRMNIDCAVFELLYYPWGNKVAEWDHNSQIILFLTRDMPIIQCLRCLWRVEYWQAVQFR